MSKRRSRPALAYEQEDGPNALVIELELVVQHWYLGKKQGWLDSISTLELAEFVRICLQ